MNPKLKILLVLGVSTAGLFGYALAKSYMFAKARTPHTLVLFDSSDSVLVSCSSVAAISHEALTLPGMKSGSTLTVSATGDNRTANEPRLIGIFAVPISEKAFEGRGKEERRLEQLLDDIKEKCEKTPSAKESSIFLALKSGVEQLRAKGCDENANCSVFVRSDLQENVEPQLKVALGGAVVSKLPSPIDNRGIQISVCGIAETRGRIDEANGKSRQLTRNRDAERFDLIRQVWGGLFAEPKLVSFSSFCPN